MRTGQQPGTYELTVALRALEAPESMFYCTTARVVRRPNYVSFLFGQHFPGAGALKGLVGVDMPYRTLTPLARTFDENFRERLRVVTKAFTAPDPLLGDKINPFGDIRRLQTASFSAHLARVIINEFAGIIDFFELEPALGNSTPIVPVIRVKSLPYIIGWFVESVDTIANELGTVPSEQTPTISGSDSGEGSP